jgi:hypothetical protein
VTGIKPVLDLLIGVHCSKHVLNVADPVIHRGIYCTRLFVPETRTRSTRLSVCMCENGGGGESKSEKMS